MELRRRKKIAPKKSLLDLFKGKKVTKRAKIIGLCAAGVIVAAVLLIVLLGNAPEPVSSGVLSVSQGTEQPSGTPSGSPGDTPEEADPSSSPDEQPTDSVEPSPSATPLPALQQGDVSDKVEKLQQRLMDLGYLDLDESTQKFGPATKLAVQWFQRQHSLEMTGIADSDTQKLLNSKSAKPYTLMEHTSGSDVDSLQRQLISLGYLGKATGYYGTETVQAVKDFQKQNKLTTDGKTGEKTLDLIYSPNAKPSPTVAGQLRSKANIEKMIATATKQLGKPYVSGNEGPKSFDCSGLVYYCLNQAGSNRGRYNAKGYSEVDDWQKITSMSKLKRGDLLFFWSSSKHKIGHVAIYIGNNTMIDASSQNGKVVKRSSVKSWCKNLFRLARRPW